MPPDPDECDDRLPAFSKSAGDEAFLHALNVRLADARFDTGSIASDPAAWPLVYIVGAPRSGTTLLSQLTSRYLPVGYIDNLVARFWLRPSVGIRLSRIVLGDRARDTIELESRHGVTRGASGPHEFGYFWRHWLHLDDAPNHHLGEDALARLDSAGLKGALEQEIIATFAAPVVFKNVICGFHAAFLTRIHPRSLFVNIERDEYATCASILRSRLERYGSYDHWWSLQPSSYPFDPPATDPCAEVALQVDACRREIRAELARPGVHAITLRYEELCANPSASMRRICDELDQLGASIRPTCAQLSPLQATGNPSLPQTMQARLLACLRGL